MPRPIGTVTPGARNFSGASRNEIASTIPSQTKVAAAATAAEVWFIVRLPVVRPRGRNSSYRVASRVAPSRHDPAWRGRAATGFPPPAMPDGDAGDDDADDDRR
ncbi:hypothetical protein GCM10023074_21030 [Microbispora amethystogenes]|uniref:Uncharacterized protein n=1 Tax=Microbispora amethystogenes TaxID=1427754 RepID=A0ABQ4FCA4_9ACTN|nr:hypothetical protein Mam01_26040 [Microbispora amethystogenes]